MNEQMVFQSLAPALIVLEVWLIAHIASCIVESLKRVHESVVAKLITEIVASLSVMFGGGGLVLWTIELCYGSM